MEASLTCAVCLSLFEEPVTLPLCSHNFCRGCVLECMASAEPAPPRPDRLLRGGGVTRAARLPCPLCRKPCPLPRGGAAALPVNTTLAEVVRLYRAGQAEVGDGARPSSPPALVGTCQKHPGQPVQLYCRMCCQAACGQCVSEQHQGIFHAVNLIYTVYQEEKLTFFSSLKKMRLINEKLINEIASLPNDTNAVLNNDAEVIAQEFAEICKTLALKKHQLLESVENQRSRKEKEFQIWRKVKDTHKKTIENFLKDCEKLVYEYDPQRFLEVACGLNARMKTQLDLMSIASSYEKPPEYIQKKMDIKPVINEILALKLTPVNVGIEDLPSGGNESSTKNTLFRNNIKQCQDQKTIPNTIPLAGQEEALADGSKMCTHLTSVSEMSSFQTMSHEELRYKYYVEHQMLTEEFKMQTFSAHKKYKFAPAEPLKDRSSGTPFVSSLTKVDKTDKIKMGTLQGAADGFQRGLSGTSDRSIPSTNMNFSETSGNLKLINERGSQEVTTPAVSENSKDLVTEEKSLMQASAVIVSNKIDTHPTTSPGLKLAASVAVTVSNSEVKDVSAERLSGSPFAFSACDNSLPRFTKDTGAFSFKKKDGKYVFPQFYLGKCDHVDKTDTQDESKLRKHDPVTKTMVSDASTSPNIDSAESKKPDFSFPFHSSERGSFTRSLSSLLRQSEKPSDKNALSHLREKNDSAKETAECGTQKPSVSGGQKAITSQSITTVACSTSETSTAAGVGGASECVLAPSNCVFSFKNSGFQLFSPVFSFGSIDRNTCDSPTSSRVLSGNGTEKTEEKIKSPDKASLNLGKPESSECTEPASLCSNPKCEGSFFPTKETESTEVLASSSSSCSQPLCSVVVPVKDENVSSTQLTIRATAQETEVNDQKNEAVAEHNNCLGREDEPKSETVQHVACSVPDTCNEPSSGGSVLAVNEAEVPSDSDSDGEELSQSSISTDSSSASEYYFVAKEKASIGGK